jgi:haloalkane dehalogenase
MIKEKSLNPQVYQEMREREVYPKNSHFLDLEVCGEKHLLHYIDEGPKDALKTIIFVHGNPTWSFYFRNYYRFFQNEYRVIGVDHIGCGLSSVTQKKLSLKQHQDNLVQLIKSLDLKNIILVAHDWGGAIGMGAVTELADRFQGVVLSNTAAFESAHIPARINMCRKSFLGTILIHWMNMFARGATWMNRRKKLSKFNKNAYLWPYEKLANRTAISQFIDDIPVNSSIESFETIKRTEDKIKQLNIPALLLWGEKDFCFHTYYLDKFQQLLKNTTVYRFAHSGHFVLEDEQVHCQMLIQQFLRGIQ